MNRTTICSNRYRRKNSALGAPLSGPARCLCALVSCLPILLTFSPLAHGDTGLVIGAGRSIEVPAASATAIDVTNGSVIKVKDQGKNIRITGKKAGSSLLQVGEERYLVTVLSEMRFALYHTLEVALKGKRGLELHAEAATGSGVISVTGRLLRWSDWLDLSQAAQNSAQDYAFEAQIEPAVLTDVKTHLARLLRDSGLPDLPLEFSPQATVTLPLEPEDLKVRVAKALRPFGFKIDRSTLSLGLEPLVRVKIIVAELNKTLIRKIGISWPAAVDATLLPMAALSQDLTITLNALEDRGVGKILASPVILCRSGKEAHFLAGGEFPIKISNRIRSEVTWKNYGVLLNVKPKADFGGRMSIALETEVSLLDKATVVDGVPGLRTNRIETHFDLNKSRTIALSGLLKEEWGRSTTGLPGLSSLPILGPLFSSRDYQDNKTELIVFVTPEVVHPDQEVL